MTAVLLDTSVLTGKRLGIEPDVIDSGRLPALGRPAELARRLATPRS